MSPQDGLRGQLHKPTPDLLGYGRARDVQLSEHRPAQGGGLPEPQREAR
jgi:hypothetical protein